MTCSSVEIPSRARSSADHAEGSHSLVDGELGHFARAGAGDDEFADLVADGHGLDDGHAPGVAGIFAAVAAAAAEKLHAVKQPGQCPGLQTFSPGYVTGSLQCEQMRRIRRCAQDKITEDEIKNGAMPMSSRRAMAPGASLQCIVDKHLMAGERGFDGDFRRLGVADFPDHDDVRILPQNGAQRVGERQADVLFGRHLVDAGNLKFHRVFDGDDVPRRAVEFVQRGIKRGGLAGTGRAGDEDQPVRRINGALELLERLLVQAQLVDARGQVGFVEHAQHDFSP